MEHDSAISQDSQNSKDSQNNSSPSETIRPYANVPTEQLEKDAAHFWSEIGHAALKLKRMMDELDNRKMTKLIEPEKVDEFKDWRGPNNG